MAGRLKLAIRALVAAAALFALAAGAGFVPLRPAVAAAAVVTVVLAGEAFIAARGHRPAGAPAREALVDTSALIDGRLVDVATTGFLELELIIPEFVLRELQSIADSSDPMRRARGRRGLDVLQALKDRPRRPARVTADDVAEENAVDLKLVTLARRRGAALITTDFNLKKVASIREVDVLNVNDLAHALRPVVLPGESLRVTIVKDGKEPGQGVAYLADGTMIVVEQGRGLAGSTIDVVVTSAIQTSAGKMFFAKPAA